jgi:hypothetical protein
MKMELYSVRDICTERYSNPFLAETDKAAIRAFEKDRQSQPFPDDFELYLVGAFDTQSGVLTALDRGPVLISDSEIQKNATEPVVKQETLDG